MPRLPKTTTDLRRISFAMYLSGALRKANIQKYELCEKIPMSQSTFYTHMRNPVMFRVTELERMATLLNISPLGLINSIINPEQFKGPDKIEDTLKEKNTRRKAG